MLRRRWPIVYDDGPTSAQHWDDASCLLGKTYFWAAFEGSGIAGVVVLNMVLSGKLGHSVDTGGLYEPGL